MVRSLLVGALLAGLVVRAEAAAPPAAVDWSAVDQALGRTGQAQPGDVHRVSFPRGDLHVTLKGIPILPALALTSWAAFHSTRHGVMVMGDLVLLDEEVNPVLSALFTAGFEVSAVHDHLIGTEPHVSYVHYSGHGGAVALAASLTRVLEVTATPKSAGAPAEAAGSIDTAAVASILGRHGKVAAGGVYQVSVPRAEQILESGMEIPAAMGVATAINLEPLEPGRAATTGDFVMIAREVNPVARALRAHGLEVTALHSHMLNEQPRLFFMHFWGVASDTALARGLRAALDGMSLARP